MKKTIKYIGFYDTYKNSNENRNACLSATNKMNYIAKTLNSLKYDVDFISPSWTINNKFYRGRYEKIDDHNKLLLFPTIPWNTRFLKLGSVIFSFTNLICYLLFKTNKDDILIAYHSRWLSLPLIIIKIMKPRLQLILEVEEIYNDVAKSKFWGPIEYQLFKHADKFIFPTNLLNKKVNIDNKPNIIIHGTYQVEDERKVRFNDEKIHIVYAGTFDPRKGGAAAAAAAAEFLPSNYHVHIVGFGSQNDTEQLISKIEEITKKTDATVTYDGLLKGEEYINFLQKCEIGLSTQIPDAEYNNTSFPSKILSYMANGLRVVTVRIEAIEKSAIGKDVYYYDEQTPKAIADAIMKIDVTEFYDSRALIRELDGKFVESIKLLLEA